MRRRSRSPAPEAPKSSIALGYPQCVELKRVPVGEASGLASFLGATEATFFLVHLACSFAAVARERFVRASLSITLEPSEPAAASQPVAWSMQPLCLPQVTELARGQKVGANFKFASVELSEESRSTRTACLIRAYNELTSDPRWEFRGRRHAELDGTQRLTMVVSTPTGASAQVTLAAHLQRPGRVPFLRRVSVLNEDNKFTLRPTSP
jgi:hypothetical protein